MAEETNFIDEQEMKRHDIIDRFTETMPEVKNYLILSEGWHAQNIRFACHAAYQLNENIVAIDPRGEISHAMKEPLERHGYEIVSFDLSLEKSNEIDIHYNGPMKKVAFFIHTAAMEATPPELVLECLDLVVKKSQEKNGDAVRLLINGFDIAYYFSDVKALLERKDLHLTVVALNLTQLWEAFGDGYEDIVNGFDAIFYFGCKDKRTYQFIIDNLTLDKDISFWQMANRRSMVWVRNWFEFEKKYIWIEYASMSIDPFG